MIDAFFRKADCRKSNQIYYRLFIKGTSENIWLGRKLPTFPNGPLHFQPTKMESFSRTLLVWTSNLEDYFPGEFSQGQTTPIQQVIVLILTIRVRAESVRKCTRLRYWSKTFSRPGLEISNTGVTPCSWRSILKICVLELWAKLKLPQLVQHL